MCVYFEDSGEFFYQKYYDTSFQVHTNFFFEFEYLHEPVQQSESKLHEDRLSRHRLLISFLEPSLELIA